MADRRNSGASPQSADLRTALWMLALGIVPLLPLMAAYRSATPAPPPPEAAQVRLAPGAAPAAFQLRYVPTWLVAVAAVGGQTGRGRPLRDWPDAC